MCKKFISYLVIYSMLYSNALYAGNGGNGGMSDPNEPRTPLVIHKKPQPSSPRPPLQNPTSHSLQDVNSVVDRSFVVSINSPQPKTTVKSKTRERAKTPPRPQLSKSTHPKKPSGTTNSLLNASPLEKVEGKKKNKKNSRSPNASGSGGTKSSLDKTSSSENLLPERSSSPSKSPDNSVSLQESQDLDSSNSSMELPPSRETSLGLQGKKASAASPQRVDLVPSETSGLLNIIHPSYTAQNPKLESLPKKEGADLENDESDSEGINFRGPSANTPQETASLAEQESREESKLSEGPESAASVFEGSPHDGLQEVTDHPLASRLTKGEQGIKGVESMEPAPDALALMKKPANAGIEAGDDPEGRKRDLLFQLDDERLPPAVKAFLLYAKDYINDGKITLPQGLIGGFGSLFVGTCVGQAMTPILSNGFRDIGGKFFRELYDDPLGANLFISHTSITLGIDSFARNMMILAELVGPSTEEFSIPSHKIKFKYVTINSRKVIVGVCYAGASVAAILPVYYLWYLEKRGADYDPNHRSEYMNFFWGLSPALFIDALLLNGRAAKRWVDSKFNAHCIDQAYAGARLSPARVTRETELERLKDLDRLFRHTSDEDIHDLYDQVLGQAYGKESKFHLSEEILKAAETIRTLQALRQIHQDYSLPEEVKDNWKKLTAQALGWGIPILALTGRSLVFFQVIYEMLNDIAPENRVMNTTFAIIFGEVIAAFFQAKVEKDAAEEAIYDILGGEDTEGDSSHNGLRNGLRKAGKTYNYFQGLWNTVPYFLVGLKVTYAWPVVWQILSLTFFCVADMFTNAMSYNESYGGAISGVESLISYKYATAPYKRNKLRRVVRHYHKIFETMNPNLLMKVDALCNLNN